jgi:hypothetical protein
MHSRDSRTHVCQTLRACSARAAATCPAALHVIATGARSRSAAWRTQVGPAAVSQPTAACSLRPRPGRRPHWHQQLVGVAIERLCAAGVVLGPLPACPCPPLQLSHRSTAPRSRDEMARCLTCTCSIGAGWLVCRSGGGSTYACTYTTLAVMSGKAPAATRQPLPGCRAGQPAAEPK